MTCKHCKRATKETIERHCESKFCPWCIACYRKMQLELRKRNIKS